MTFRASGISASSISIFRNSFNDVHETVQRFQAWMMAPTGAGRAKNTALAYSSCVRTLLIRVLVRNEQPGEAVAAGAWPSAGSAWRMFRAFTHLGGTFTDDGVLINMSGVDKQLPAVIELIDSWFNTQMGDLLTEADLTRCVQAVWRVGLPDGLSVAPLGKAFMQPAPDLYMLAPAVLAAEPAVARAMVRFALWSHAGATPDLDAPLLTAWPYNPAVTKEQTHMPAFALWDAAARVIPEGDIALPPEGEALLAGEAIDFSGVAPVEPALDPAPFITCRAPRHATRPAGTRQEQIRRLAVERVRYNHLHHNRATPDAEIIQAFGPDGLDAVRAEEAAKAVEAMAREAAAGWSLAVDVAGVPDDPQGTPTVDAAEPSRTVSGEEGLTSGEVALTAGEDFDSPVLPG